MIASTLSLSSAASLQRYLKSSNTNITSSEFLPTRNLYEKYSNDVIKSIAHSFSSPLLDGNRSEFIYEISKLSSIFQIGESNFSWISYPTTRTNNIFADLLYPLPTDFGSEYAKTSHTVLEPIQKRVFKVNYPTKVIMQKPKLTHDLLIAITICNQIKMTMVTLSYLTKGLQGLADIVIMDDASTDGSSVYLKNHGYFVLTSNKPRGLTYHWNKAYQLSIDLGYKHIIFMNNDVLVPQGAIKEILKDIPFVPLLVPLSTLAGAGHNPSQSLIRAYNLSKSHENYVRNPRNVQFIQNALTKKYIMQGGDRMVPSTFNGQSKFNGFFFVVNILKSKDASFQYPYLLFDNTSIIVGQEDSFVKQMKSFELLPYISLNTFCYHYKSVTISSGLNKKRPLSMKIDKKQDIRENLEIYHATNSTSSNEENDLHTSWKIIMSSATDMSNEHDTKQFDIFERHQYPVKILDGSSELIEQTHEENDMNIMKGKCVSSLEVSCTIIAFITSDPIINPSAGDVFTAYELANGLLLLYNQTISEVRYIRKNINWYKPSQMKGVTVLISMLDDFDVTKVKATSLKFQSMLTVAWIRNWHNRWLTRSYIGNFNLILVSSNRAKHFFEHYGVTFGFQSKCYQYCPKLPVAKQIFVREISHDQKVMNNIDSQPIQANGLFQKLQTFSNRVFLASTISKKPSQFLQNQSMINISTSDSINNYTFDVEKRSSNIISRVNIPIKVLRLATNPDRFSTDVKSLKEVFLHDYGFTGSYYNSPRAITKFDPSKLSDRFSGVVIGSNWERATNVSEGWKNMSIGKMPYSKMPNVYKSLKIVVDDANHVTEPWGSINSRVFDAISSGSLVVTNGKFGSDEICDGKIPTYKSPEDLVNILDYYLSRPKERRELSKIVRGCVITKHTYKHRAIELASFLMDFGIILKTKNDYPATETPYVHPLSTISDSKLLFKKNICVGIRTYADHFKWIEVLIRNLLAQHNASRFKSNISIKLFLVDTEMKSSSYQAYLQGLVKVFNEEFIDKYNPKVILLVDNMQSTDESRKANPFYGYDATDMLLEFMTKSEFASKSPCDWIMFTNGDNVYNSAWLDTISPMILNPKADYNAIAWDFVTHHARSGEKQQLIKVVMKRKFVDLGSIMIKAELFSKFDLKYLPESVFTTDVIARDFHIVDKLIGLIPPQSVRLIHRCLMFHQ